MDVSEIIRDICWHDSVVRKVVDLPEAGKHRLLIELDYPVDWENDVIETHTIQFLDVYNYEIHEGPCMGSPTIMDANELDERWSDAGVHTIRIDTTWGYRIVRCKSLSLEKGKASLSVALREPNSDDHPDGR